MKFQFHKIRSTLFGFIYRPYADIICYGKHGKPRKISMLVDTGADHTILPRREAALLGIDISQDCITEVTHGVGGSQTMYLYKKLQVSLGDQKLEVPVGFLDTNNVPPLLGRHGFMELFKTCFAERIVSFEPGSNLSSSKR